LAAAEMARLFGAEAAEVKHERTRLPPSTACRPVPDAHSLLECPAGCACLVTEVR
jgi:hypothetical protein